MTQDASPGGEDVDQDAEPSLNAPGEAGPTGIEAAGETPPRDEAAEKAAESDDQDAGPSRNAPGDAGPA